MIEHGHVDVKYAHYVLDFYLGDANHKVESFAKLLQDLEKPSTSSSCALFKDFRILISFMRHYLIPGVHLP